MKSTTTIQAKTAPQPQPTKNEKQVEINEWILEAFRAAFRKLNEDERQKQAAEN